MIQSNLYPEEDRTKARLAYSRIMGLAKRIADSRRGGEPLRQIDFDAAVALTESTDPETQFKALTAVAEETRKMHLNRLYPLAKEDFAAYCEVMNPDEAPTSPWHKFLTSTLQSIDTDPKMNNLVLNCPPGHAKDSRLDTPIFTPNGWTTMGEISAGDQVFDDKGKPCTVVWKSPVYKNQKIYKITTDCGDEIFCGAGHEWPVVLDDKVRPATVRGRYKKKNPNPYVIKTAEFLAERKQRMNVHRKAKIFRAPALDFPASNEPLIIDPYVLGVWLRDGSKSSGKTTSDPKDSVWLISELERLGYEINPHMCPKDFGVVDFMTKDKAKALNLHENKHIPERYLMASAQDRLSLLQGLIDTDGTVAPDGQVMFCQKNYQMCLDVQYLVRSLGAKATIIESRAVLNGRDYGPVWRVGFYMANAARMPRKRDLCRDAVRTVNTYIDIEEAGYADTQCIQVSSESHLFLVGKSMTPTHNSTYASRLFISWRMGRDPDLKVLGASHTQNFVEKEFSKIIREQTLSEPFKKVFPNFLIDPGSRANDQWNVANHKGQYVAKGVGQSIHGFRFNMVVVDDPYPNITKARSPAYRKEVETFVLGDIGTRMLPGGKIFIVMTRFDAEDITQTIIDMNDGFPDEFKFQIIAVPAICYDEETDVMGRKAGELLWDFYNYDHFKVQLQKLRYAQFSLIHQQMTDAVNPDSLASKFQFYDVLPHLTKEALASAPIDQETGKPIPQRDQYFKRVVASVDTANKDTARADYSVIQIWGEGHDKRHYLLDQVRSKVAFNDLIVFIERTARKWNVDAILVEDKGNGLSYIQNRGSTNYQSRKAPAPVIPISTPGNQGKAIRLDSASPMIEAGEVFLPEKAPWLDSFIQEVGQFPDGSNDDQVDAMSQYLNWVRSRRTRFGSKKITSFG